MMEEITLNAQFFSNIVFTDAATFEVNRIYTTAGIGHIQTTTG